jgi:cytochrome c oxidase cbb3-type subunit IV
MKSLALSQFQNIHLTAVGLLIFFVYFCGVLWWVSRKSAQKNYQKMQNLPFDDGE